MKPQKILAQTLLSAVLSAGISLAAQASSFYDDGLVAYSEGNYSAAVSLFKQAVKAGEAGADHMLMRLYSEGKGVEKDKVQAFQWSLRAAESGIMQAQFQVAERYANGDGTPVNPKAAYKWYRAAAKQGHHVAYFRLAQMFEKGVGVKADTDEAKRLYVIAASDFDVYAQKGDANSQTTLASMYEKGEGVHRNIQLALKWYQKAALQGFALAEYHLGRMYSGAVEDVEANPGEAAYWLERAADHGNNQARDMLAELRKVKGSDLALL